MCGRFTLLATGDEIAAEFDLPAAPDVRPRYNIAPTQSVLAIRTAADGMRDGVPLHWGLIPSWSRDPSMAARMINARGETLTEKPAFRGAFKERRCLIPCSGFYEWRPIEGAKRKQPYFIRMADESLFGLAGLWERGKDAEGKQIESCTVITTEPNDLIRPLHDRMPVILDRRNFSQWLECSKQDLSKLTSLLCPFPAVRMFAFPVGLTVNAARNDTPACIEPLYK